jgi:eukaryotic-like serine/threonine-protein kinase
MIDDGERVSHIGWQFGNYRLLQLLRVQQKVSTYLGEHIYLQAHAIIQLYQLRLLQEDEHNFLNEVRRLAHLVHPHILRVLEFGVEHDTPFLILASAAGGPFLSRHPRGTPLPSSTLLSSVMQIASALDYAHQEQVYHLDLRPENVWLGPNDGVLLSNFRMTFFAQSSRSEHVEDIAAAMASLAPEQIQGLPSAASDQYALAVMVYEWLCGVHPFPGEDYLAIASQQLYTPPPSLVARVQHLPPRIEQVVLRALAKDAAQRFPSVQAFATALEQSYRVPENSSRYSINIPENFTTTSQIAHNPNYSEHARMRLSRRTVAFGVAGLLGTATVGGGLIWFLRPSSNKPLATKKFPPGTTFSTYRKQVDTIYGVAWSLDGQRIASWSRDGTMQVWDITTDALLHTYPMAAVLCCSPDWRLIVSGGLTGFQMWEFPTGRTLITQNITYTGGGRSLDLPINSYAKWAPNGRYMVTAIDATQVWDVTTAKALFTYPPGAIAWSPDGKYIALIADTFGDSTPHNVQILEVATEKLVSSYLMPTSASSDESSLLVWSPDGKYLASGNGQIWHATTGKVVNTYKGSLGNFVWSPDSRYLASFDDTQALQIPQYANMPKVDPTVQIWNMLTGKNVFIYRGHTAGVNYVAWSPDGKKIASVSADMTVKIWQAPA